jgi:hypothetical protein
MFCTAVLFKLRSLLLRSHLFAPLPHEPSFSARRRPAYIQMFQQTPLDLLVIGGGITGAGIALDARTRGLHVGLVEMQDFAAGTSSRSTKLVHGGLRYLKQFELKLVAEVGRERAIVHANAPHVTHPVPMLLPLTRGGSLRKWEAALALSVYDFLAGVKPAERRRMLSAAATLKQEPLLTPTASWAAPCTTNTAPTTPASPSKSSRKPCTAAPWPSTTPKQRASSTRTARSAAPPSPTELTGESFSGAGPAGGERGRPLGRRRGYAQ